VRSESRQLNEGNSRHSCWHFCCNSLFEFDKFIRSVNLMRELLFFVAICSLSRWLCHTDARNLIRLVISVRRIHRPRSLRYWVVCRACDSRSLRPFLNLSKDVLEINQVKNVVVVTVVFASVRGLDTAFCLRLRRRGRLRERMRRHKDVSIATVQGLARGLVPRSACNRGGGGHTVTFAIGKGFRCKDKCVVPGQLLPLRCLC